jgi:hypothetical protein
MKQDMEVIRQNCECKNLNAGERLDGPHGFAKPFLFVLVHDHSPFDDARYDVVIRAACLVEDVMPRLVTVNLIFLPIEEAKQKADVLRKAMDVLAKG